MTQEPATTPASPEPSEPSDAKAEEIAPVQESAPEPQAEAAEAYAQSSAPAPTAPAEATAPFNAAPAAPETAPESVAGEPQAGMPEAAQPAGAAPGAGGMTFSPDAGSIESLDSVRHAILNAAMMNKGMTMENRDDINMALESRWKDPGQAQKEAAPEQELPDSMLPLLKEVLPYIDYIARKQEELESAISDRDSPEDAGSKLRALGESIRETAEIGVSKGLAERDYVPTQITVNEPAPDPSDPFAGGSDATLERAGADGIPEEANASSQEPHQDGGPGDAQSPAAQQDAMPQEPPEFTLAPEAPAGEIPEPDAAPLPPQAPMEPPAMEQPASAIAAPEGASEQEIAQTHAPDPAQPPLSQSEIEKISLAASEDKSDGLEDIAAPGPMMFGPDEGYVEGRRPGESVQEMLARVQEAAKAQLEAEDHGAATLGGESEAETEPAPAPFQASLSEPEAQAMPQLGAPIQPQAQLHPQAQPVQDVIGADLQAPAAKAPEAAPQAQPKAESAFAPSQPSSEEPIPAPPAPSVAEADGASQFKAEGPAQDGSAATAHPDGHGLRLIADPFSDDMSVSMVEARRPVEDLASAEAEYAASPKAGAVSQGAQEQGSEPARPSNAAAPVMPESLRRALLEIEGGSAEPEPSKASEASASHHVPEEIAASAKAQASSSSTVLSSAPALEPAPEPAPATEKASGQAQEDMPPDLGEYVPPSDDGDEDPDDEDDAGDGMEEASQGEAAVAAFEGMQDSSVAQGVGEQAQVLTPEPLPDGDPASMPPAQRAELERIEKIEAGQQVRPLISQDFMPFVRKADPWLQDIEAAGYKDALYSALISSSRTVDPSDSSHWILRMSERFSYFINDPSFSHNLETKFSFLRSGHPVRITIERCEGVPEGCPLALASKALRDETLKARQKMASFKPFMRILSLAGASFDKVPITLYGSAGAAIPVRAAQKGGPKA